jgi:hypothetical protein
VQRGGDEVVELVEVAGPQHRGGVEQAGVGAQLGDGARLRVVRKWRV